MVAEDKLLCLRKSKKEQAPKLEAFDKIMSMPEGAIASLRASDPSFDAMFASSGMMSALMDPEVMASYSPERQRGMAIMFSGLQHPGLLYSGCPVRVQGRTIGTCCCLYLDHPDDVSDAEKAGQMRYAAQIGELLASFSDVSKVGGSPPPSPAKRPPAELSVMEGAGGISPNKMLEFYRDVENLASPNRALNRASSSDA